MPLELNRLFFALWPTDAVREACAAASRHLRMRMPPGGRVTPAERLHLTLLFLGSTVSSEAEGAARALADGLRSPPFTLHLDQASSFHRRNHIWWLGARTVPAELRNLHDTLREGMGKVPLDLGRGRFLPHVTLVRDATAALPVTPITPVAWPVSEFVLVRSRFNQDGGAYDIVGRWPLVAQDRQPPQMQLPL